MRNRFRGLQHALASAVLTLVAQQSVAALPSHPIVHTFTPTPEEIATGTSIYAGFSVAIQNDTALITKLGLDKVDVYKRTAGGWTRTGSITAPEAATGFGRRLAYQNGTAIVGADGAVYVFRLAGGTWRNTAKLTAAPGEAPFFPLTLDFQNNLVVVGNTNRNAPGVAYVYRLDPAGRLVRQLRLQPQDSQPNDGFGTSVALSDCTIVIGAPGSSGGAAYVFERSSTGWSQTHRLSVSDSVNEGFGSAVQINDQGVIAVGAPNEDPQNVDLSTSDPTAAGAAFVFVKRRSGAYAEAERIRPSSADVTNFVGYGERILMSGNKLVVDGHELFQGPSDFATHYTFTYTLAQGRATPLALTPLTPPPASSSLSGRWLLIGQPYEPGCEPNTCVGRALLFDINQLQ